MADKSPAWAPPGAGVDTVPFVSGSETSRLAAESMQPSVRSIRAEVYRAIAASGRQGMTDDEVEVHLDLRHQTASARRRELVLQGRVVNRGLGKGDKRVTRSERKAFVWIAHTHANAAEMAHWARVPPMPTLPCPRCGGCGKVAAPRAEGDQLILV